MTDDNEHTKDLNAELAALAARLDGSEKAIHRAETRAYNEMTAAIAARMAETQQEAFDEMAAAVVDARMAKTVQEAQEVREKAIEAAAQRGAPYVDRKALNEHFEWVEMEMIDAPSTSFFQPANTELLDKVLATPRVHLVDDTVLQSPPVELTVEERASLTEMEGRNYSPPMADVISTVRDLNDALAASRADSVDDTSDDEAAVGEDAFVAIDWTEDGEGIDESSDQSVVKTFASVDGTITASSIAAGAITSATIATWQESAAIKDVKDVNASLHKMLTISIVGNVVAVAVACLGVALKLI